MLLNFKSEMKYLVLTTKISAVILFTGLLLSLKCANTGDVPAKVPPTKIAVAGFLTEKQYNELFPMRDKFYSYAAFVKAVKEMSWIKVKIVRRAVSVYQFTRTDKRTNKPTVVRQDEDWNEAWAKKKPDSSYVIDYGNFCSDKDLQTSKKELAAFFANIAHETRHG